MYKDNINQKLTKSYGALHLLAKVHNYDSNSNKNQTHLYDFCIDIQNKPLDCKNNVLHCLK